MYICSSCAYYSIMEYSKEVALQIKIIYPDGKELRDSLYRPGNPPDYAQIYMQTSFKDTDDKEGELDQVRNSKVLLNDDQLISHKNRCSENLKNSPKEAHHIKSFFQEVTHLVSIYRDDGTLSERSTQCFDSTVPLIQEFLTKQRDLGSSNINDPLEHEKKLHLRKHELLFRKKGKIKYTESTNGYAQLDIWIVNQTSTENPTSEISKQASSTPIWESLVIIWIICLIGFQKTAEAKECMESLSTLTLTSSCPTTEEQWTEKANQKRCATYLQSCSPPEEFVYHCLVNAFGNGTVEVCAPRKRTSYCVEFNSLGARIQANFHTNCTNTTTDCGRFYNSNEIYKVPQCISTIREPLVPYNISETKSPVPLQSTKNEIGTTDSYYTFTVNQTRDSRSRYANESRNDANNQLGYVMVGIFVIPVAVILFTALHYTLCLIDQKCNKPQVKNKIEACCFINEEYCGLKLHQANSTEEEFIGISIT